MLSYCGWYKGYGDRGDNCQRIEGAWDQANQLSGRKSLVQGSECPEYTRQYKTIDSAIHEGFSCDGSSNDGDVFWQIEQDSLTEVRYGGVEECRQSNNDETKSEWRHGRWSGFRSSA